LISETFILSPVFSNLAKSTSKVSTKSFGKHFTSTCFKTSSIIAPSSVLAFEIHTKVKGILV
jgi:hypothetical protein